MSVKDNTAGLSYSHSEGLYAGGSIAGEMLLTRRIDNEDFYMKKGIRAAQILSGSVPRPDSAAARELYDILDRVCNDETPKLSSFLPSLGRSRALPHMAS